MAEPIPAERMLTVSSVAEVAYCGRSAWYEVQAGRRKARNAAVEAGFLEDQDRLDRRLEERPEVTRHRAVNVEHPGLGLRGQVDVVEDDGEALLAIEYRHGRSPGTATDRLVILLLAVMLEDLTGRPTSARLVFLTDRQGVDVEVTEASRREATEAVARARAIFEAADPPPNPLLPACRGCSWFGICAPDLSAASAEERARALPRRRFERVLYVEEPGAKLRLKGRAVRVGKGDEELLSVGLETLDQVVLVGDGTHLTTPALRELARSGVDVVLLAWNGRFEGRVVSERFRNPALRRAQHRRSLDPAFRLRVARAIVEAKVSNQRVQLQRLRRRQACEVTDRVLGQMQSAASRARGRADLEALRGDEGMAGRAYFEGLRAQLEARGKSFPGRNRRPPRDPVNALLSFAYAMLAKDVEAALQVVGLDPCLGLYHSERYGRPALALDLMEEFRPVIADAVVLKLLNKNMVQDKHFVERLAAVELQPAGRKKLYRAWEDRMTEQVSHPLFGTSYSYRRTIELQARLLAKVFEGDVSDYVPFRMR